MSAGARLPVSYVLPLRWEGSGPLEELTAYLREVSEWVEEVVVVDGSPPPVFARNARALGATAWHLPPDPDLEFAMGKVNGVLSGVRAASLDLVVIADDDVRYDRASLTRTAELLGSADLVRPQNYFAELPWHARWDTARTLLNRVFTGDLDFPVGDFPGTLAVRRESFRRSGAYDGDALFENLELMRTIRAGGGTVLTPLDLYVARRAPSTEHFLSQRVRQAYDDFGVPLRMAAFLSIAPLAARALLRGRPGRVALGAAVAVALAEIGRRRGGGAGRFPASASLLAPAWIGERAICAWLALGARLRGGVRYGERRIGHAATPMRQLRKRTALWVPSQKGRICERPQRQRATTGRFSSISLPSWSTRTNGPRTR